MCVFRGGREYFEMLLGERVVELVTDDVLQDACLEESEQDGVVSDVVRAADLQTDRGQRRRAS